MKAFVAPTGLYSRAMLRVAAALTQHAPVGVQIVDSEAEADIIIRHVIGPEKPIDKNYVVIQYCGSQVPGMFQELWACARLVWSYYDLRGQIPDTTPFFFAPLGVDEVFSANAKLGNTRTIGLITSGYSTGPLQEAIEEAVFACEATGQSFVHIGPGTIEGMTRYPKTWNTQLNIPDAQLVQLYRNAKRVSGLRHIEGFELPALEGLLQGARPVLFDRKDMRMWYDGLAEFVPECSGPELEERLTQLFKTEPTPVTPEERDRVIRQFDWSKIVANFWDAIIAMTPSTRVVSVASRRRVLWVGDAGAATGFERGTRYICNALTDHMDVAVLGINHHGDPVDYHPTKRPNGYKFDTYPCISGGDALGQRRIKGMIDALQPALVILQNDPWNIPGYMRFIEDVPTIGYIAVDGKHCRGVALNGLTKAIFWTKFGETQAKEGGFAGDTAVIPLGVDRSIYIRGNAQELRDTMGVSSVFQQRGMPKDSFIIGVVGRNKWRKRLDLTIQYYAEWIQSRQIRDAFLWVHSAPTGDDAWDLLDLAKYYGVHDRVGIPKIQRTLRATPEDHMARMYSTFDALFTTTLGEGMWLPGLEAAACGVPIVAPDWSAVGEIFADHALLVPCTSTAVHPNQTNTVGGVMDKESAFTALDTLYYDKDRRAYYSEKSLALAVKPEYDWSHVAHAFLNEIEKTLNLQQTPELVLA